KGLRNHSINQLPRFNVIQKFGTPCNNYQSPSLRSGQLLTSADQWLNLKAQHPRRTTNKQTINRKSVTYIVFRSKEKQKTPYLRLKDYYYCNHPNIYKVVKYGS